MAELFQENRLPTLPTGDQTQGLFHAREILWPWVIIPDQDKILLIRKALAIIRGTHTRHVCIGEPCEFCELQGIRDLLCTENSIKQGPEMDL